MIKIAIISFFFIFSSIAFAQEFTGVVSAATGNSGRATVEPGDSIFLNPATLVHLRGFHFSVASANKSFKTSDRESELIISLADNSGESVVPASLGYLQRRDQSDGIIVLSKDIELVLANFAMERFSVGFTLRQLSHVIDLTSSTQSYEQTNGHIGFLFTPTSNVGMGLVFYDLANTDIKVPLSYRVRSRVGAGFNYIYESFLRLRVDALSDEDNDTNKMIYMFGFESYVQDFFVLRFGKQAGTQGVENIDKNLTTAGFGFTGPKFSMNYAYQARAGDSSFIMHAVDLVIPF